ncbi:hypothetical protein ACLPHM_05710 [Paenalcaligenes sp. Me131]|uniref:hypothetical protein n=1 Tax=Paenalcaligenes sp. Me131 TaxID=3392636 RepID=UPI003D2D3A9C
MDINIENIAKLLAPILTAIIGFILKKYFEARPKLINFLIHASAIPLGDGTGNEVNTHSIVIRNAGKKTAHNVRLGHNFLPAFNVFPAVAYSTVPGPNNSVELIFPTLVPSEQIFISYLYFPPNLWSHVNTYCKSDEMNSKYVNVTPTIQPSKIQLFVFWALIFIGASTLAYWLIFLFLAWVGA